MVSFTRITKKRLRHFFIAALTIAIVILAVIEFTEFVNGDNHAQALVQKFGYVGVLIIAAVAGFNVFLPVPAATFVPIFTEAGLWLPFIVLMLIIGTTIADIAGYLIGGMSKDFAAKEYLKIYERFIKIQSKNYRFLLPLIFLYAAFIPFPNEAFLIPIAIMGVPLRTFIFPLVVGTLFHQTILAYGAQEVFSIFFGV